MPVFSQKYRKILLHFSLHLFHRAYGLYARGGFSLYLFNFQTDLLRVCVCVCVGGGANISKLIKRGRMYSTLFAAFISTEFFSYPVIFSHLFNSLIDVSWYFLSSELVMVGGGKQCVKFLNFYLGGSNVSICLRRQRHRKFDHGRTVIVKLADKFDYKKKISSAGSASEEGYFGM